MRRAHNAEFESRNQPLQFVDNFGSILADKLRMKGNPCCPDFFPVCQLTHSSKPVQAAGQTQIEGAACIGMFVETPQQLVLLFLVKFDFLAQPEIDNTFEIFLQQEQRFVGVGRGSQAGKAGVSVLLPNRFKAVVNDLQKIGNVLRVA